MRRVCLSHKWEKVCLGLKWGKVPHCKWNGMSRPQVRSYLSAVNEKRYVLVQMRKVNWRSLCRQTRKVLPHLSLLSFILNYVLTWSPRQVIIWYVQSLHFISCRSLHCVQFLLSFDHYMSHFNGHISCVYRLCKCFIFFWWCMC